MDQVTQIQGFFLARSSM